MTFNYDSDKSDGKHIPFPPDTEAFMSPEKLENYASELHQVMILRLSKVDRTFYLLRRNGLPCSHPLYSLSKHYSPLYEKLREEQFIPDDLDRVLATFPIKKKDPIYPE